MFREDTIHRKSTPENYQNSINSVNLQKTKLKTQKKSLAFLYTNNKEWNEKLRKQSYLTSHQKE